MADQENRDDALEQLFREKSREYNISYREEDWQKLEGRLDNLDQQRKKKTRRRLIAAAVALVISVLAYFIFQNQQQINKLNERLSSRQNQPPAIEQQKEKDSGNPQDAPANQNAPSHFADNPKNQPPEVQNSTTPKKSGTATQQGERAGQKQMNGTQRPSGQATQTFASYSLTEQQPSAIPSAGGEQNRMTPPSESQLTEAGSLTPRTVRPAAEETESTAQPGSPTVRRTSPLSLGLVLGPDLSTAGGIDHFYDPGYKIGVTVDYKISPRLAITSGIIRTRTRYTASGGEYRAPAGYWTDGITPDRTKANCVLLDIPVSLKYDFLRFSNSRLYATAGVSSYIMLDEQYRFEYESEYYQADLKQSWSEKTGTRHWMSNVGFSLGYELDISQNWSLRAEPFLKVPIKKIGWGNVNLYSMGTMVSLNFNFSGRR